MDDSLGLFIPGLQRFDRLPQVNQLRVLNKRLINVTAASLQRISVRCMNGPFDVDLLFDVFECHVLVQYLLCKEYIFY